MVEICSNASQFPSPYEFHFLRSLLLPHIASLPFSPGFPLHCPSDKISNDYCNIITLELATSVLMAVDGQDENGL